MRILLLFCLWVGPSRAFAPQQRAHAAISSPSLIKNQEEIPTSTRSADSLFHQNPTKTTTTQLFGTNGEYTNGSDQKPYRHILAILTMPYTSRDRVANEAVLNTALAQTKKLSIVLRTQDKHAHPSLGSLRRYVGEVYSQLWDFAMQHDVVYFNDVCVYPQNLPNSGNEPWLHHRSDLDAVCSHDSLCGWVTESALGRGTQFQFMEGNGVGGLDTHVAAVNADRAERDLPPVTALHVTHWPMGASEEQCEKEHVVFVDDEELPPPPVDEEEDGGVSGPLVGGARIPTKSLYNKVAVGGTFDGLHYGHRKLLTLAVSSVTPVTGKLMVGVTVDDMLKHKQYADFIPSVQERMHGVRQFLHRLAPGMKNRIIIEPIADAYGPPGRAPDGDSYDALVLSHETLETGVQLNQYRQNTLGYDPLALLCTRRTEAFGMSSTTLRRLRSMKKLTEETVV